MTEGTKHDAGKPRFDLMQFEALDRYAKVLTFGAAKYSPDNWRKVPELKRRYFRAALGHLFRWAAGEERDVESGESHLAHAMCCVAFILETECEEGLA